MNGLKVKRYSSLPPSTLIYTLQYNKGHTPCSLTCHRCLATVVPQRIVLFVCWGDLGQMCCWGQIIFSSFNTSIVKKDVYLWNRDIVRDRERQRDKNRAKKEHIDIMYVKVSIIY